jgi:hypothetical protein
VKKRHEEGRTDDRPHDRKRIAAYAEDERLGEVELPRDPPIAVETMSPPRAPPPSALPMAPQIAAMMINTMSPGSVSVIQASLRQAA